MSDAISFIKQEDETLKAFNERISDYCDDEHVTEGILDMVDGQPVVTLLSDEPEPVEGEEVEDDGGPIAIKIAKVSATDQKAADKSESFLNKLFEIAEDGVVDFKFAQGTGFLWITHTELVELKKSVYMHAEYVPGRQGPFYGAEFAEPPEGAPPRPRFENPKNQYAAARRDDTALIKFMVSYAMVAYVIIKDEDEDHQPEDAPATEEATSPETNDDPGANEGNEEPVAEEKEPKPKQKNKGAKKKAPAKEEVTK